MATNVLDSTHPTIDPDRPTRTHATIGEEWQIIYSQGGIVMSTMLRAATRVLARPDLQLSAMSATFIKPVPMGDVVIDVEVLRSGRNGAQTSIELRDATSAANGDGPNTVITAVFIAADDNAPTVRSLSCPPELLGTPTPEHVAAIAQGVAKRATQGNASNTRAEEVGRMVPVVAALGMAAASEG